MDMKITKSCFNISEVLQQSKYFCQVRFRTREGTSDVTIYQLSPAIQFAFFDFRCKAYIMNNNRRNHMLEINYVREGRSEHGLANGTVQYVGKNDLFFYRESFHTPETFFPLGYYTGIGIVIDLDNLDVVKRTLATHIHIDFAALSEKLLSLGTDFCLNMEPSIQNLHVIPPHLSEGATCAWLRLKVSELMIYLNDYPLEQELPRKNYERHQVGIIKDIHHELTQNLQTRYTIDELAARYYISSTKLKATFKGVYGEAIGAYMKNYKIRQAAQWLREGDLNIEEISAEVGYKNASKFSAAFKEAMGATPISYRKQHQ